MNRRQERSALGRRPPPGDTGVSPSWRDGGRQSLALGALGAPSPAPRAGEAAQPTFVSTEWLSRLRRPAVRLRGVPDLPGSKLRPRVYLWLSKQLRQRLPANMGLRPRTPVRLARTSPSHRPSAPVPAAPGAPGSGPAPRPRLPSSCRGPKEGRGAGLSETCQLVQTLSPPCPERGSPAWLIIPGPCRSRRGRRPTPCFSDSAELTETLTFGLPR